MASPARLASRFGFGGKTRVDLARRTMVPLLVALIPFFWVADATHRAALTTLGRDQGIFQYIAWAVGFGDRDYKDIRDVNGPLTHLIHRVFLLLGSADEHRFHVLELACTGLSFAIAGACIPGLWAKRVTWAERLAWALASWSVLSVQYQLYLYWNQAQRESFCDWFLLPSLALQAATPSRHPARRVMIVGALSVIPWFGKANFAIFTMLQLVVLLLDREVRLSWRAKIARFALGGAIGSLLPLSYLLHYGDIRSFLRITFVDVPSIYRFMWAKSVQEILGDEGPLNVATAGLATGALMVALVIYRELPRRALALALAPVCAVIGALAQHKGFGYHFHPATATTSFCWLLLVALLWERFRGVPRSRPLGRWVALGVAAAFALERASAMRGSPQTKNYWILGGGETAEDRAKSEYFATFKSYDFFPWEIRQAATYINEVTSPDARVQSYSMDPYLLFLAKRRSATPYIYAYDLNDDAALEGGWHNRPSPQQKANIAGARDAHEQDMLTHLKAAPPEAFVFIDNAPLMSWPDAWEDFRHCCIDSATWVAGHYHPARSFGGVHVWLRDDSRVLDSDQAIP